MKVLRSESTYLRTSELNSFIHSFFSKPFILVKVAADSELILGILGVMSEYIPNGMLGYQRTVYVFDWRTLRKFLLKLMTQKSELRIKLEL